VPRDRNPENNRYVATYADEDILDAVRECDPPTTTAIADAVGCNQSTAYRRLTELADDGTVERQKVGNTNVWFVVDE